ncbi:TetR/AcrR family transcriptional regulator [Nocardia cyriacigeorgica]|uniref:TetR/AcrR family transcriptional regulator n=1 Tax=Nocardia cyriacigeorgica TaxID=135487 RepID=A0A5R8PAV5_9NOCA|nr:TetR/AcrR family transcriptional regulator [Nocardia cyriacigeorgica]TLG05336.1 TetR/AcrR family transcriptional regulator [Nocardia cyriacigeorgica]
MPRNRRPRDREEKRGEIVAAARRLFIEQGYEAVSVARIAQEAGVVSNTVYWYFQDKDSVLIAVLDEVLADSMQRYSDRAHTDLTDQLVWVVAELEQVSRLVTTVHARSKESGLVREWHERFHALAEGVFRLELAELGFTTDDLDAVVTMGVFVIEGLLMHTAEVADKQAVLSAFVRGARQLALAQ